MVLLAIGFALVSAVTTALSTATQHHAATSAPRGADAVGLMGHLVRQPSWLLALGLGPVGFACHAAALHFGPIALVQPLAITGIVLAVPIRAAWSRVRPCPVELVAVVVTAGAIAALLLVSDPQPAIQGVAPATLLVPVLSCGAAGAGLLLLAAGARTSPTRAQLLGSTAGILFGSMAVLMEASTSYADEHGAMSLAVTWLPYATVAAGLGGITVNQIAYRTARLSASMPILNVVNCVLTLGFGYLVLHETPRSGPVVLILSTAALAAMAAGLWVLARQDDRLASRDRTRRSAPAGPPVRDAHRQHCERHGPTEDRRSGAVAARTTGPH